MGAPPGARKPRTRRVHSQKPVVEEQRDDTTGPHPKHNPHPGGMAARRVFTTLICKPTFRNNLRFLQDRPYSDTLSRLRPITGKHQLSIPICVNLRHPGITHPPLHKFGHTRPVSGLLRTSFWSEATDPCFQAAFGCIFHLRCHSPVCVNFTQKCVNFTHQPFS